MAETRRFARTAAPLLALITGLFALYQLFLAGLSARMHSYPFALFYALMGAAGLAIATALSRVWRGR